MGFYPLYPRSPLRRLLMAAWLLTPSAAILAGQAGPAGSPAPGGLELGLSPVFGDDFESGECSLWSDTSNPRGAPDGDDDDFGDTNQPTAYCQLPTDFVADFTDCNDANAAIHPGATELCNGLDDDCDALTADGIGDPQTGVSCDGVDSDLCLEGTNLCTDGQILCSDDTASTIDLCNGLDDDCDPASADGSEDPQNGIACDSLADSDLCATGTTSCPAGTLECSDDAVSAFDLCNGLDDDCDSSSVDGSEDPLLGAACDGTQDTDLCLEGTYSCPAGALDCSDATGSTVELCAGNGADEDCDGAIDEGFILDDNPACWGINLGSIEGDGTSEDLIRTEFSEERFLLLVLDVDSCVNDSVGIRVTLESPPGTDFDLFLQCFDCGGSNPGRASTVHGLSGHTDTVILSAFDDCFQDDSFFALIEVRHFSSLLCAIWTLTIEGNMEDEMDRTCGGDDRPSPLTAPTPFELQATPAPR